MSSRAYVCSDPVRREAFLSLVRAQPRITLTDLAAPLGVSVATVFKLLHALEAEGKVVSEIDPSARRSPRSSPPRVVWIPPRRPARIGKPKIPRPTGFTKPRPALQDWPYRHTGTPADCAGGIQVLRACGRLLPADRRRQ